MTNGLLSVDEALGRLLEGARPVTGTETSRRSPPPARARAGADLDARRPAARQHLDGRIAVRSADCASGAARLRISQRIPAGAIGRPLEPKTAARVFTGAPIPPGADAVVPQEQTAADGITSSSKHAEPGDGSGGQARTSAPAPRSSKRACGAGPGSRARRVGRNRAAPGVPQGRAALFSTGNELVMPGEPLPPGAIYNSSRFTLTGLFRMLGCEIEDLGIVPDTLAATREALRRAAAMSDIIVTSGGVSVGDEDHVRPAADAEGKVDLWRIALKPDRPLAFGAVRRADGGEASFIGLPGNPVSQLRDLRPLRPAVRAAAARRDRGHAARACTAGGFRLAEARRPVDVPARVVNVSGGGWISLRTSWPGRRHLDGCGRRAVSTTRRSRPSGKAIWCGSCRFRSCSIRADP